MHYMSILHGDKDEIHSYIDRRTADWVGKGNM